jgi:DNA-binding transcriptional LysR family regulator
MEKDLFKSRVRLRHLDCFVAVAQTRNLGRAAEKMRQTQPAMSKTLTELEEIVGVKLLERNRLGAQLTRDGEVFLEHAVAVLDALNTARMAIGSQQAPKNEAVYIGALPTVAPDLLPPALNAFRSRFPEAKVAVQTAANAALLQMLKAGEIDFALARMADPQMMPGLTFELLYVEPLVLAVRPAHPLAAANAASLADILAYPLVVSPKGTIPRHNTESLLQSHGLKMPSNCMETLTVSLARQVVRQSDAVWFTPIGAVREDFADGALSRLAVSTEGSEEPVGLLQRSEGAPAAPARALIALLRETAASRRSQIDQ